MKVLVLIIFTFATVSCQSIEDGIAGIQPLVTSRKNVDKAFGQSKRIEPGYFQYDSNDYYIELNFTTAPCEKDPLGRGEFRVPVDTVLSYIILPKRSVTLDQFHFKREEYRKDSSGDLLGVSEYQRVKGGVVISVIERNGAEYIREVRYSPTIAQEKEQKCR